MAKNVSLFRMRKGLITSGFVTLVVAAFWLGAPVGCANMIPPGGGPRDTIPPVFVNAIPSDSTVNFKGDRIVLDFDEELDDPREPRNNIIFTPSFEIDPIVTTRGKAVTVNFKDAKLESNTTYVINFGNAIVDLTEGNAAKNFVYTFSTGPYLDSLEISGKVVLAENGGIDTTMNVVLYKDLSDSAIKLKNALYVTRLDRSGNFHFHNLANDTFAIYAFGQGRRYQTNQLFAFRDTTIIAGQADSLVLYAYREGNSRPVTSLVNTGSIKLPANDRRLRFTPSTTSQQELLNDFTLAFPVPLKSFDSTKMHLTTDSVFNPENFTASLDTARKEARIKTAWKEGTTYHLILEKDFANDTAGRQLLKTDTLSFVTKKKADYGSLALKIRNIGAFKNPVLQFVQNNQAVYSVPIKTGVYNETLFIPGEYTLRIFDDVNGNGKLDPGNFFEGKIQPEIVHPISQPITIKANWDNEFERVL
jgi:hypothetical protein